MNILIIAIFALIIAEQLLHRKKRNSYYITNQTPLVVQPYTTLPLGAIKPQGFC